LGPAERRKKGGRRRRRGKGGGKEAVGIVLSPVPKVHGERKEKKKKKD